MKFYIPTASLNFNNIMSTGSISPAIFYEKREFGIRKFYSNSLNFDPMCILLYSEILSSDVEEHDGDIELDNYPMYIAVESEMYDSSFFEKLRDDEDYKILRCRQTLFFHYENTFFYFRTEDEKKSTLAKASRSHEIKFDKLFQDHILIINFDVTENDKYFGDIDHFLAEYNKGENDCENSLEKIIDNDKKYNYAIGFFYCYYIGIMMETTYEYDKLNYCADKLIYKDLSSINASPEKIAQNYEIEKIESNFTKFLASIDSIIYNYILSLLKKNYCLSDDDSINVEKYLKKLPDLYDTFLSDKFSSYKDVNQKIEILKKDILAFLEYKYKLTDEYYAAIKENIEEIVQTLMTIRFENYTGVFYCHFDIDQDCTIKKQFIDIDDSARSDPHIDYFIPIINILVSQEYKNYSKKNPEKQKIAKDWDSRSLLLGSYADIFMNQLNEEQWKSTDLRNKYLLPLLQWSRKPDVNPIPKTTHSFLQSLTIFCQSWNNDKEIEKLIENLIDNNFYIYKYAFSLFGAKTGLADLPKTLTEFFIMKDVKIFTDFYDYIYRSLLHIYHHDSNINSNTDHNTNSDLPNNYIKTETENSKKSEISSNNSYNASHVQINEK